MWTAPCTSSWVRSFAAPAENPTHSIAVAPWVLISAATHTGPARIGGPTRTARKPPARHDIIILSTQSLVYVLSLLPELLVTCVLIDIGREGAPRLRYSWLTEGMHCCADCCLQSSKLAFVYIFQLQILHRWWRHLGGLVADAAYVVLFTGVFIGNCCTGLAIHITVPCQQAVSPTPYISPRVDRQTCRRS